MDDLNPITRTERLLDGEDLTPTNREEMFIKRIYDKTQEIPEPVNRKEYFLKKAGEASGDVTVVPLSVTDNGIYSEEGKAYSPVTVEVSPPEDSYQLKSITTPTSLATFTASAMPMPTLKASIKAKQASGVPSPSNPLPITGWDAVVVSDTGINIWDEEWEVGALSTTDGTPQVSTVTIRSKNFSPCISGTSYYIKCANYTDRYTLAIYWYDSDKAFISREYVCAMVTNAPENAKYFKIVTNSSGTVYGTTYNNDISINYPSTDHDYHAYNDTTTTITLPQTVYGGEVDVVNGGGNSNCVKLSLAEICTNVQNFGDYSLFYSNDLSSYGVKDTPSSSSDFYGLCDTYKMMAYNSEMHATDNSVSVRSDNTRKAVYVRTDGTSQTLPTGYVLLELATTTTFTTQPTPIKSLNGTNNLSVDSGDVIEGEYFKALGGE